MKRQNINIGKNPYICISIYYICISHISIKGLANGEEFLQTSKKSNSVFLKLPRKTSIEGICLKKKAATHKSPKSYMRGNHHLTVIRKKLNSNRTLLYHRKWEHLKNVDLLYYFAYCID